MSSFGAQMRKRLNELRKAGQDVPRIIRETAEGATIEAVRVATEKTPPNSGTRGTNTQSGQLAQHWQTDSRTSPIGGKTTLANNMQYASYVNDGHRVDKHFVPGLTVDGGTLQKAPAGSDTGLTVGVKTTYVPGLYMKEAGVGRYKTVVKTELDKRVREAFQ
ncbi:MAG: HK97 gp10 family phage protein [Clostridiales bacterium]|nr:HK97 gp10 family phage protein [Clostridiales bacterium]MBQ1574347.1 HK97 gp10 family phage protein [Clostridiales bacterium]